MSAIEMNDKMLSLAKFTCCQVFSVGFITYLCPTVIFMSSSLCGFPNSFSKIEMKL